MSYEEQNSSQRCAELEALIQVVDILTAIPEQIKTKEDLLVLLKEQDSYLDKIKFSPERQTSYVLLSDKQKGKNLLEDFEPSYKQKLSPDFQEKILNLRNADEARLLLAQELDKEGLSFETIDYQPPISHDERHIIRMDFNGKAYQPSDDYFSDAYLNLLENPSSEKVDASAYNMEENTSWQTFKKFPRFQLIESDFKQALAYAHIPPSAIKDLNSFDFEDLLFRFKTRDKENASCASLFAEGGARENAVKIHAQNHKEELRAYFKQLGAAEGKDVGQIDYVLNKMIKNGKIPPLQLQDGEYLTATVHHNVDVTDAGMFDDITKVNHAQNFSIIFQKNAKDAENINYATQSSAFDSNFILALNNHKIDTGISKQDIDLNLLSEDKEAKAEFIKKVTKEKYQEFYMAFKDMGFSKEQITSTILTMAREGKVPQLDLKQNKMLVLGIKAPRRDNKNAQIYFGVQDKPSYYDDVHHNILHGIDKRPVKLEIPEENTPQNKSILFSNDLPQNPTNVKSERESYEITGKGNILKKVFFRIRMKFKKSADKNGQKKYPIFVLGGLGEQHTIWSNEKDNRDNQNSAQNLNKKVIEKQLSQQRHTTPNL